MTKCVRGKGHDLKIEIKFTNAERKNYVMKICADFAFFDVSTLIYWEPKQSRRTKVVENFHPTQNLFFFVPPENVSIVFHGEHSLVNRE